MEAQLVRSGDIGDEAGQSAGDAGPLDLDAVRADDDLIEALSAGLVPPPSAARDTSDVEGELVALLAGWVADVRPETLLHRPEPPKQAVRAEDTPENTPEHAAEDDVPVMASSSGTPSLLELNELPRPVALARWRSAAARPYLLRAAAALVAVALVGSGVVARSYDAHPGEPLWAVTQMAFPAKSHSVEAAITVSTALNTARVALESGHIDEAREAFQTVAAQLGDVDPSDGRAELDHQMTYLNAQLAADPAATDAPQAPPNALGQRPLATGAAGAVIPSGPAVTPGATTALTTPPPPPSALAAGPDVTAEHSPEGTAPAPPAESAPAPSGDALAAGPAPADAPADQASNSAPPVAGGSANGSAGEPAAGASTTTDRAAPTTEPQAGHPTAEPTTQQNTSDPAVTGTADHGDPPSGGDSPHPTTDGSGDGSGSSGGGGGSGDSGDSGAGSDKSGSGDTKDKSINTDGTAGSNPGQVTGVVTNTSDSGS